MDSDGYHFWELILSISFIWVLAGIAMDMGSQSMELYIKTRLMGWKMYTFAKCIVVLDIFVHFIREKRISEKVVLKNISETSLHYLKTFFLIDLVSNVFILLSIFS